MAVVTGPVMETVEGCSERVEVTVTNSVVGSTKVEVTVTGAKDVV